MTPNAYMRAVRACRGYWSRKRDPDRARDRALDLRLAHSLSAADASLPGLRCSAAIDWSQPWDGGRDPYADSPAARSIHWIPDAEGERGE